MTKGAPATVGAVIGDVLNAYLVPGSSTAGTLIGSALERTISKRAETARDIIIQEIAEGRRLKNDTDEIDEFVAILYRYLRAAQEGTARLNLRLMARVINSQLEREGLYASEFLRYAEIISSLTREEVILIGTRYRERENYRRSRNQEHWSDAKTINGIVATSLVPRLFKDEGELTATTTALQRTGMVVSGGFINEVGPTGGTIWLDTPLLGANCKTLRLFLAWISGKRKLPAFAGFVEFSFSIEPCRLIAPSA